MEGTDHALRTGIAQCHTPAYAIYPFDSVLSVSGAVLVCGDAQSHGQSLHSAAVSVVTSRNPVGAFASNHDRWSSVYRAIRLTLFRRINQLARSWPVRSDDSTRVARHPNPRGAIVHKLFPPDVWLGQSFPTPHLRQAHQPERASTNHIQTPGNTRDVPHKSGKACH